VLRKKRPGKQGSFCTCFITDMHKEYEQYCLAASDLKMEGVGSSKLLAAFYQTTWHHIPKDNTLCCYCHDTPWNVTCNEQLNSNKNICA